MKPKLLVIPSIDIKDGKTVRVVRGIPELYCPQYGSDPVEMAMIWRAENARCIHVVDFDAAWELSNRNMNIIEKICASVIIPVELGGGIRNLEEASRAFDAGVYRLVIGSLIYDNFPEFKRIIEKFGPQKIAAAIDSIDNEVVIKSRSKKAGISAADAAMHLLECGVERFIVTDVTANGMMLGPNIPLSRHIAEITQKKVTLSGGIRNKDDLMDIQNNYDSGIDSVIVGRALYENKFPCQRLWRIAESGIFS